MIHCVFQLLEIQLRFVTDKAVMIHLCLQYIRDSVSLRYGQGCDDWFVYSNYKKLAFVALRTRLW